MQDDSDRRQPTDPPPFEPDRSTIGLANQFYDHMQSMNDLSRVHFEGALNDMRILLGNHKQRARVEAKISEYEKLEANFAKELATIRTVAQHPNAKATQETRALAQKAEQVIRERCELLQDFRRRILAEQAATAVDFGEGRKLFEAALSNLAVVGGFSNHVSMIFNGMPTSTQGSLASIVHAKMCANAGSIGAITQSGMFDHAAIMSISRMVMEGMTTFYYLRAPVSADMWRLRDLVLRLHATTVQITNLRAHKAKADYADYTAGRISLLKQIKEHPLFATLRPEQRDKIVTGHEIFIGGMRKAALETGAWTEAMFTAIYSYLSTHSHSAPLTFLRRSGVDYLNPTDYQFGISAYGIEVAAKCLRRTTLRYIDDSRESHPDAEEPFSTQFIEKMREDDNHYGLIFGDSDP